MAMQTVTVYLASPLFTQAERVWNRRLVEHLSLVMPEARIILPQNEAMKFVTGKTINFQGIVEECIRGLNAADVVVAVLDGSDADSGTCWECGYAYAKGKRVIGVRTDLRGSEDEGLNAMLRRTCKTIIYTPAIQEDVQTLAEEIASAILEGK